MYSSRDSVRIRGQALLYCTTPVTVAPSTGYTVRIESTEGVHCFKKVNEIKPTFYVEFDIRSGDISFNEWVSHLKPVTSEPDFVLPKIRED